MRKPILYLFLFLISGTAIGQVKNTDAKKLIGQLFFQTDELSQFKGYKENEGVVLEPTEAKFILSKMVNSAQDNILIFYKTLDIKEGGKNRLLDTLHLGKVPKTKIVIMASCRLNKKNDSEIVALVQYKAIPTYRTILKAWRANKKTGKFEKISTKNIVCTDVGYTDED